MKSPYYLVVISFALITSGGPAFAECGHPKVKKATSDSTRNTPAEVCETLRRLADKFGEVKIVSGFRGVADNRRRGGAKGSMHTKGRAVDVVLEYTGHPNGPFPVAPNQFARTKEVNAFLKQFPTRYNIYKTGRIHIDDSTGYPDNYDSNFKRAFRSRDYSNYASSGTANDELKEQLASVPTPVPTIPDPTAAMRSPASDLVTDVADAAAPVEEPVTDPAPVYTPPPAPSPKKKKNQYTKRGIGKNYAQTRYFQKRYYDGETTNDIMMRALGQR